MQWPWMTWTGRFNLTDKRWTKNTIRMSILFIIYSWNAILETAYFDEQLLHCLKAWSIQIAIYYKVDAFLAQETASRIINNGDDYGSMIKHNFVNYQGDNYSYTPLGSAFVSYSAKYQLHNLQPKKQTRMHIASNSTDVNGLGCLPEMLLPWLRMIHN